MILIDGQRVSANLSFEGGFKVSNPLHLKLLKSAAIEVENAIFANLKSLGGKPRRVSASGNKGYFWTAAYIKRNKTFNRVARVESLVLIIFDSMMEYIVYSKEPLSTLWFEAKLDDVSTDTSSYNSAFFKILDEK